MNQSVYDVYCDTIKRLVKFNVSFEYILDWLHCQYVLDSRLDDFDTYLQLKNYIIREVSA